MIRKKAISILVVMSFLMTTFAISMGSVRANPNDWREGQVWGYKLQINFADLKSYIEKQIRENATIEALDLNGGASEYFYMKYLGNTSEGYVLEFKGGSYEEIHFLGKVKNETSEYSGYEIAYISSDYNGTLWLTRGTSYYGVSKIKCDVNVSFNYNLSYENHFSVENSAEKGDVEFRNLEINCSPSIAMLPMDMENAESLQEYDTEVLCSGERSGHLSYADYNGTARTFIPYQNLSKQISNSTSVYISNYTLPILGLTGLGLLEPLNGTFEDISLYSIQAGNAYINYNNSFISLIKYVFFLGLKPTTSQPATEDEVNEYLQDKKGHTPGISRESGNTNGNNFLTGIIIKCLAVTFVVIALISVLRRKRKIPENPSAPYKPNPPGGTLSPTENLEEEETEHPSESSTYEPSEAEKLVVKEIEALIDKGSIKEAVKELIDNKNNIGDDEWIRLRNRCMKGK